MKTALWIALEAVVLLGMLGIIGWQTTNSLTQELAVRDATIANLTASLEQAQNTPPEIQYVEVEKFVDRVVEKKVYIDRPIEVIKFPEWKVFNTIEDFPKVSIAGFLPDNCLPMAQAVQEMLLKQGYITSIAVSWQGYYDGIYVTSAPGAHAGLLVETKAGWFFVDLDPWRVTKLF